VVHRVNVRDDALNRIAATKLKDSARFGALSWGLDDVLAGGMTDGTVRFWKASTLEHLGSIQDTHVKGTVVRACQFNPLADAKHWLASGGADKQVFVSDVSRGFAQPASSVPADKPSHAAEVTAVAWNPETSFILASAAADGSVIVWDLRGKKTFCEIRDSSRNAAVTALAWNPAQGLLMMTGSESGAMKLYDLRASKTTALIELAGHAGGVFDMSWCPHDPSLVASCGKDNAVALWDLQTRQEVQRIEDPGAGLSAVSFAKTRAASAESVFSGGGGGGGGGGGAGSHGSASSGVAGVSRRFQVDWSPSMRGMLAACSFDRSVTVVSLIGAGSVMPRAPSRAPMRAPAWFRRPCRARFGFGAQLVSCNAATSEVLVETVNVERVAPRARHFEASLDSAVRHDQHLQSATHEHLVAFCQEQVRRAVSNEEAEVWRFMIVLFTGVNTRIELQTFLGFDEATVEQETDYSYCPDLSEPVNVGVVAGMKPVDDIAETPVDKLITRALIVANFRAAVALSFQHGRDADALLLASLGGSDLMKAAHRAYLARQTPCRPLMRVAETLSNGDVFGGMRSADLSKPGMWKQTLASLSTVSREEDFSAVCAALGERLEAAPVPDGQAAATICYMLSRHVSKTVSMWAKSASHAAVCERALVFQHVLPSMDALTMDPVAMSHFAKFALQLADDGEVDLAARHALMASAMDLEAAALLDRLYNHDPERIAAAVGGVPYSPWQVTPVGPAPAPPAPPAPPMQPMQQPQHVTGWPAQPPTSTAQQQQFNAYGATALYAPPAAAVARQPAVAAASAAPQQPAYGYAPAAPAAPAAAASAYNGYQQPYAAPPQPPQPPQQQQHYAAPYGAQSYTAPPAAPAYAPPAYAPTYQAPPPPPSYSAHPPPQQQQQQPSPPAAYSQQSFAPQQQQAPPLPAYQPPAGWPAEEPKGVPRIPENDGFGTTAGNPLAGARFGNRGTPTPPQAQPQEAAPPAPPPKPAVLPAAMVPAMASLERFLGALAQPQRPYTVQEQRQLNEAEAGLAALRGKLCVGLVNDHAQSDLRDFAARVDQGNFKEAHRVQVNLTTTNWNEHKDWVKALRHLVALAERDQPLAAASPPAPPTSHIAPPPMTTAPPPPQPPPPPSYAYPPSMQQQGYGGKPY